MRTIIIDNGSGQIKAGVAGDPIPRSVVPTIIGRPRHKSVMLAASQAVYVGRAAQSN